MNGLSYIRRRCNLSQGQLAAKLGVSRQAVNLWECRREPLPQARRAQLSAFFGLEPEFFGEITPEQKEELLRRPCYLYRDDDGQDYLLFSGDRARNRKLMMGEKQGRALTRNEQAALDRRELEELLDILRRAVFPKDRTRWTAWDSETAMNRMRHILGGMTCALEAIQTHPPKRRMDCFYLMMQTELALALALGGIAQEDLPAQHSCARQLDTDYIIALAGQFCSWLQARAAAADAAQCPAPRQDG